MTTKQDYEPYIRNLVLMIQQLLADAMKERAKQPSKPENWHFQDGVVYGLLTILGTMKSQAQTYGLSQDEIGLGDFQFEREYQRLIVGTRGRKAVR